MIFVRSFPSNGSFSESAVRRWGCSAHWARARWRGCWRRRDGISVTGVRSIGSFPAVHGRLGISFLVSSNGPCPLPVQKKEPIVLAGDFTHLVKSGKQIPQLHCMRDPLSPPFHPNLIYGLRFFQVTVLCPFRDRQEQPLPARSVPVRFEVSPVLSKPGKKATEQERAHYRKALKQRLSSVAARQVLQELREDFDRAGAHSRQLLVALDGSFCNQVFFKKAILGVELLCRCRKDAVLCLAHQSVHGHKGPKRFYDPRSFTPDSVRQNETIPWQKGSFFHGGGFHPIRYKNSKRYSGAREVAGVFCASW